MVTPSPPSPAGQQVAVKGTFESWQNEHGTDYGWLSAEMKPDGRVVLRGRGGIMRLSPDTAAKLKDWLPETSPVSP